MYEFPPLTDCWYLTGATASGKTCVGLELADRIDAEIISLDSMAVYRGMDIGTAKPSLEDQSQVVHHLLDIVDPNDSFSLADYLEAAHECVEKIKSKGLQVLFVGGTPLYLKSLLRGVCEGPPADAVFRREVEEEIDRVGIGALRERLRQVDPLSAAKLHENDKRRMIRALEVYKLTGTPISHYQIQFEEPSSNLCERVFALSWQRAALHQRINERVDSMFERGLVEEVRALLKAYGGFSETALQGVGYRELVEFLSGNANYEEAVTQTKTRTRRFARRQETWFRGLVECRWVPVDGKCEPSDIVEQIVSGFA